MQCSMRLTSILLTSCNFFKGIPSLNDLTAFLFTSTKHIVCTTCD